MEQDSTKTDADGTTLFAGDAWFDPIEAGIRDRVRGFIEELLEQELTAALGRTRHERAEGEPAGYRNGTRERQLLGSFGPVARIRPVRAAATGWSGCYGVDLVARSPVPREQLVQTGRGVVCDAAQNISKPGAGIDAVQLGRDDERVHRRCPFAATVGAGEQPGL